MIERAMNRFDLYPARLLGDSAYGSAEMLGWLVYEQGIEPHVPVFDKSARRDGTFSADDSTYDHDGDVYYCPGGLTTTGSRVNDATTLRYRASKYDCEACRLKPRCCPKEPARYVPRSIYEGARDMARQIARSWEGRIARRLRKKVEMRQDGRSRAARGALRSASDPNLLRRVFETVLRRCIREGLVGGEGFAIDASLIKADANRQNGIAGEKGLPSEATGRAVEEYLAVLDDAAFGAATDVTPKFVSPADPAARWTGAHGGQAFFAYSTNYLIDVDNAIIVDVEATTAIRQAEVLAAKRMIERAMNRFDLYPARLLGDSAYGSAEMLGWLVYEHGIEPHVTVFDKSARQDGTFSRDDFTYDHDGDVYYCPGGKILTTTGSRINDGATLRYHASKYDCEACRLKPRCCPKEPARYVPRSIYEGARDMARQIARSWEGRIARRLRKKVEMLFAHLKRILKLDRLRLRGPNGAHDEFLLAATAQNLRKLAKLIPVPNLKPA